MRGYVPPMARRVREIERKYEAVAGEAPRQSEFDGLPGVADIRELTPVALDAMYLDTADLRLAARRITLRRRRGGEDAGWHLKLPADRPDTRTEVHAPLGGSVREVPTELADLVAAYTRGEPLRPVVRLKCDRRRVRLLGVRGEPLAEIAHDRVTAQNLDGPAVTITSWSETESELLGGKPTLLDAVEERLAAAGLHRSASPSKLARAIGERRLKAARMPPNRPASRDRAGDAVLCYLHQQVAAVIGYDPAVRRDEPDAVHQMRVATRRLRSALRSFRRELDRAVTDPIGEELKWLAAVLGVERDREVLAERLTERIGELDEGVAGTELRQRLLGSDATTGRSEARDTLLRELNGERYFALLDTLEALLAAPPYTDAAGAPAVRALTRAVRRDHRRLRRLVEAALSTGPGTGRNVAMHDARKAAKRARYSSEAAEPVLNGPARKHTRRMKAVQSLLGEHQDSVICRDALAGAARRARAAGEDVFPYGALDELERRRSAAAEERLPAVWRAADRGRLSA
jgi:CHAD domain-containing protein